MGNFFKNFGKGVLYFLALPALVLGLAIYAVAAVFIFLFIAVKGLVLFFTGRSLYEDLPEDIEAKRRLDVLAGASASGTTIVSTEDLMNANENQSANSTDPFYVPEYLKQEAIVEKEETPSEEVNTQEDLMEDAPAEPQERSVYDILTEDENKPSPEVNIEPENNEEDVIVVENKPQNSVILDINEIDDEDEEEHSGINIDYE